MEKESNAAPLEIPSEQLSDDALLGVLEDFILREGTDYGWSEIDHAEKLRRLRGQLKKGDVKIVFDPSIESVTLMTRAEWNKLSAAAR